MTSLNLPIGKERVSHVEVDNIFEETGETLVMEIDPEMLSLITQQMTDLYRNPLESAIRETVSNALDSSEEGEVVITAPNYMNPQVVISDTGSGMSPEDVKSIYRLYGASTKRTNLNTIGAKGAGAKSPLAYTHTFSVTTVRDGVMTSFTMTRGDTQNTVEILDPVSTDKPNGTTVIIPIEEQDVFKACEIIHNNWGKYDIHRRVKIEGVNIPEGDKFERNYAKLTTISIQDTANCIEVDVYMNKDPKLVPLYWDDWFPQQLDENGELKDLYLKKLYGAVIGGYLYYEGDYIPQLPFIVDLKPGLVNFPTSREEITDDSRSQRFFREVHRHVYNLSQEKFFLKKGNIYESLILENIDDIENKFLAKFLTIYKVNPRQDFVFESEIKDVA